MLLTPLVSMTPFTDLVRNGQNLLHDMLAEMFERARGIAEDNKYNDEEIDKICNWRKVPVVGFNSAKFDLNLILSELECDEWYSSR